MSERPSAGIGKRVAKYRKIAGLSARELSEKLGGELSRGVIANIESGRKTDVTIDQLIALAWALDVPPVMLALPIEEPSVNVRMTENPNGKQCLPALDAVLWFHADFKLHQQIANGFGQILANELIRAAKESQNE